MFVGSILVAHQRRQEVLLEPVMLSMMSLPAASRPDGSHCQRAFHKLARCDRKSGPMVVEEDLGDAGGLLQGGEVSGVAKRDRSGATKPGEVGFTVWQARPVVIAVDQSDRGGDTTVERSGG